MKQRLAVFMGVFDSTHNGSPSAHYNLYPFFINQSDHLLNSPLSGANKKRIVPRHSRL